jgi:hypothetical protein
MVAARDTPVLRRRRVLGAISFGAAALTLIGLYGGLLAASPKLPLKLEALQLDRFTRILAEAR